jgi:hypothetical protein
MLVVDPMKRITFVCVCVLTSKFSKASKLALQPIKAGSVKPRTIGHFFAILEAVSLLY